MSLAVCSLQPPAALVKVPRVSLGPKLLRSPPVCRERPAYLHPGIRPGNVDDGKVFYVTYGYFCLSEHLRSALRTSTTITTIATTATTITHRLGPTLNNWTTLLQESFDIPRRRAPSGPTPERCARDRNITLPALQSCPPADCAVSCRLLLFVNFFHPSTKFQGQGQGGVEWERIKRNFGFLSPFAVREGRERIPLRLSPRSCASRDRGPSISQVSLLGPY